MTDLARFRDKLGLGLREAARAADVPPATFKRLEDGGRPSLETYDKIMAWAKEVRTARVKLDERWWK